MGFAVMSNPGLMQDLCRAIGIDPGITSRLVIDLPVNGACVCYAITYPPAAETVLPPLIKLVQGITISERGDISTTPLPLTDTSRMLARAVLAGELEAARALADEIIEHCGGK